MLKRYAEMKEMEEMLKVYAPEDMEEIEECQRKIHGLYAQVPGTKVRVPKTFEEVEEEWSRRLTLLSTLVGRILAARERAWEKRNTSLEAP